MMQGDAYGLAFEILNDSDILVTSEEISDLEITIGMLKKTLKKGEVEFSDGKWIFPLTQEDTFAFYPGKVKAQMRIVWANGNVEGVDLGRIDVLESMSKAVL